MYRMKNKILEIIADVLLIERNEINEDSSPDTIENWDSLNQLNIIAAIEEEFNFQLDDEDIGDMLNVKLIIKIVEEYLQKN